MRQLYYSALSLTPHSRRCRALGTIRARVRGMLLRLSQLSPWLGLLGDRVRILNVGRFTDLHTLCKGPRTHMLRFWSPKLYRLWYLQQKTTFFGYLDLLGYGGFSKAACPWRP